MASPRPLFEALVATLRLLCPPPVFTARQEEPFPLPSTGLQIQLFHPLSPGTQEHGLRSEAPVRRWSPGMANPPASSGRNVCCLRTRLSNFLDFGDAVSACGAGGRNVQAKLNFCFFSSSAQGQGLCLSLNLGVWLQSSTGRHVEGAVQRALTRRLRPAKPPPPAEGAEEQTRQGLNRKTLFAKVCFGRAGEKDREQRMMQSEGLTMLIRASLLLVALVAPCGDAFMHFPAIARPSSPSTRSYFSAASRPAAPVHGTLVSRNAVKEMTRRTAEAMSEEKGRAEFELNRGQAVDTLLNDYTTLYKGDPDFSIFTQDVVLRDVQVSVEGLGASPRIPSWQAMATPSRV